MDAKLNFTVTGKTNSKLPYFRDRTCCSSATKIGPKLILLIVFHIYEKTIINYLHKKIQIN